MGVEEQFREIYEKLGLVHKIPNDLSEYITDGQIIELDLRFLEITNLPEGIFDKLSSLRRLSIAGNRLSKLPEGVFDQLNRLQELGLHINCLSTFPEGIFNKLIRLQKLFLDRNQLSNFPDGIFDKLASLETLHLNFNHISTLPSGIFDKLTSLEELDLSSNLLSTLPQGIFDRMLKLEKVTLKQNPGLSSFGFDEYIAENRAEVVAFINRMRLLIQEKKEVEQEGMKVDQAVKEDEEGRITALLTNILKIIQQVTPNIQVQLTRIVELCQGNKQEVENLLNIILRDNPELGQFLEFEQVFIRKEINLTDDLLSRSVSNITTSRFGSGDGLQVCPNCDETQSTLIRVCTNCKTPLPFCNLCKRGFAQTEPQLCCPNCEHPYHRNHLFGYIQSKGECPVCKEGLTLSQFE